MEKKLMEGSTRVLNDWVWETGKGLSSRTATNPLGYIIWILSGGLALSSAITEIAKSLPSSMIFSSSFFFFFFFSSFFVRKKRHITTENVIFVPGYETSRGIYRSNGNRLIRRRKRKNTQRMERKEKKTSRIRMTFETSRGWIEYRRPFPWRWKNS